MLGFAGAALLSWHFATEEKWRTLGLIALALSCCSAVLCHCYGIFQVVFPLALGEAARTWKRRQLDIAVWGALALSAVPLLFFRPDLSSFTLVRSNPDFWAKPSFRGFLLFYPHLLGSIAELFLFGIVASIMLQVFATSLRETKKRLLTLLSSLGTSLSPAVVFFLFLP